MGVGVEVVGVSLQDFRADQHIQHLLWKLELDVEVLGDLLGGEFLSFEVLKEMEVDAGAYYAICPESMLNFNEPCQFLYAVFTIGLFSS